MTALAEVADKPLEKQRELELWREIRAEGGYEGSLPGRIAIRAMEDGAKAEILVDDEVLGTAKDELGTMATFDVDSMVRQHQTALAEAAGSGVHIHSQPTDVPVLLQALSRGWRLMLAFAIINGTKVTLHWRLYRMDKGGIWEMDPASGHDTPLTENMFLGRLRAGDRYIGLGVVLGSKVSPPAF
jgi:hypothetical protein